MSLHRRRCASSGRKAAKALWIFLAGIPVRAIQLGTGNCSWCSMMTRWWWTLVVMMRSWTSAPSSLRNSSPLAS